MFDTMKKCDNCKNPKKLLIPVVLYNAVVVTAGAYVESAKLEICFDCFHNHKSWIA